MNGRIVERDIRAAARAPMAAAHTSSQVRRDRSIRRTTARSPSRPFAERSPIGWSRVHRPPPA